MGPEEATTLVLGKVVPEAALGVAALVGDGGRGGAVDHDGRRGRKRELTRLVVEARADIA